MSRDIRRRKKTEIEKKISSYMIDAREDLPDEYDARRKIG